MLANALKNKTQSFVNHYKGKKDNEPSLKDAKAKYRVKRYGKKKDSNQQIFMRALTIRMAKHGLVQHYVWILYGKVEKEIEQSLKKLLITLGDIILR